MSRLFVYSPNWIDWIKKNVFQLYILLLLQDPHAEEFEDKEWTFVIENVS